MCKRLFPQLPGILTILSSMPRTTSPGCFSYSPNASCVRGQTHWEKRQLLWCPALCSNYVCPTRYKRDHTRYCHPWSCNDLWKNCRTFTDHAEALSQSGHAGIVLWAFDAENDTVMTPPFALISFHKLVQIQDWSKNIPPVVTMKESVSYTFDRAYICPESVQNLHLICNPVARDALGASSQQTMLGLKSRRRDAGPPGLMVSWFSKLSMHISLCISLYSIHQNMGQSHSIHITSVWSVTDIQAENGVPSKDTFLLRQSAPAKRLFLGFSDA